jgi:hypothetical protein
MLQRNEAACGSAAAAAGPSRTATVDLSIRRGRDRERCATPEFRRRQRRHASAPPGQGEVHAAAEAEHRCLEDHHAAYGAAVGAAPALQTGTANGGGEDVASSLRLALHPDSCVGREMMLERKAAPRPRRAVARAFAFFSPQHSTDDRRHGQPATSTQGSNCTQTAAAVHTAPRRIPSGHVRRAVGAARAAPLGHGSCPSHGTRCRRQQQSTFFDDNCKPCRGLLPRCEAPITALAGLPVLPLRRPGRAAAPACGAGATGAHKRFRSASRRLRSGAGP